MQTYVEYVIKGLIENPDSMEIEAEDKMVLQFSKSNFILMTWGR